MSKRWRVLVILLIIAVFLAAGIWLVLNYSLARNKNTKEIIKIGILHSLTGSMAVTEKPMVDIELMAIDEINENGGLLGKKIVPVIRDAKSDWPTFAKEAEWLILEEKVSAIFGAVTSASRKLVKPIVEKYNILFFYPAQYEGIETSPNIIYLGATANQQVIPGVIWCLNNLGKRFFLLGSDFIYPRAVNNIVKELLIGRDGIVVGEIYISPDQENFDSIIKKISETKADVILNNIIGEQNEPFFAALRKAGISSEKIPTMSFTITETELAAFRIENFIGDYATQNYFQVVDTPANNFLIKQFKKKYGANRVISNHMENAYIALYFWKFAVANAKTTATDKVREQLSNVALRAPQDVIQIDRTTQHTWQPVLIGKIFPNKQFGIVWDSINTIRPLPYPPLRSKEYWQHMLEKIYLSYNNKWWR